MIELDFDNGLLAASVHLVFVMLCLSMLLGLLRLVRGPTLPDRVIALDLIGTTVVGVIAVHTIAEGEPVYLMAAVVVALIMFLGTVAFAFYVQKGGLS
ncbi:MAG: monovalent cation/H+ antiporter complex subunit F [Planctomycetaceae bacterium]